MKTTLLVAVPPGPVTVMTPLVAPGGTGVVILPSPTTVYVAPVPLNLTAVVPVKPDPKIDTWVPTGPLAGEKLVIFGPNTLKSVELWPVPDGVTTEIRPVVAPGGTVVVILPSLTTVNVALVPLNLTAVAPVKPEPRTATFVPIGPLVGEKLSIAGPITLKSVLL